MRRQLGRSVGSDGLTETVVDIACVDVGFLPHGVYPRATSARSVSYRSRRLEDQGDFESTAREEDGRDRFPSNHYVRRGRQYSHLSHPTISYNALAHHGDPFLIITSADVRP
jgi:hypothetical protein